jgi:hypothetical protein
MNSRNRINKPLDRLVRVWVNVRLASKAAVPLAKWYVHRAVSRRQGTRSGRVFRAFGL